MEHIQKEIIESNLETVKDYLTGALHDGSLTTGHRVKYFQHNKSWITQVIQPCLKSAYNLTFGPKAVYWDHSKWVLHFGNQLVWKELASRRQRNLKDLSKNAATPYIRAFWDTDGGCPRHPSAQRKLYIDFTQKNPIILRTVKDILNSYGIITGGIRKSERKSTGDIHRFAITGKPGMLLFVCMINSWHPAKRLRLERMRQLIEASAKDVE